jgi:acetolactate synthase-1/2/3 large subunit
VAPAISYARAEAASFTLPADWLPADPTALAPGGEFTLGTIHQIAGALAGTERPLIFAGRAAFLAGRASRWVISEPPQAR